MADELGGSGNTDLDDVQKAAAAKAVADAEAAAKNKTFKQEDVDRIVQERLAKSKKQLEDTQKMLDDFKNNKTLTDEQQQAMQDQISSLQKTIFSKEELSAKEKKELATQLTKKLEELEKDRNDWKGRYETSSVERAIFDEVRDDAFDPQQFIDMLRPNTKLIPEVIEGKVTGRYLPTIKFVGQDADGKSVPMELSVKDTVKEMKKMTGKYGNLFKSGLNSGLGGNNAGGTGVGLKDADIKSHEDYMKNREEIKKSRLQ